MQLLVNRLYSIRTKGVINLPPPSTALPREKPLPIDKALTRWEKFAKEKGIVKKKRSKMIWDEEKQQWAPRYGFGRANNPKDTTQDWLVHAKPGDDGSIDPFEAKADEKKMRLTKQKKQEERNRLEATHSASLSAKSGMQMSDRKQHLSNSIQAAQISTASAGRFDRVVANEPSKNKGKRQQYETATSRDANSNDEARAKKVVSKMFPENSAIAIDRTQAAKGARMAEEVSNRSKQGGKGKQSGKGGSGGKSKPAKGALKGPIKKSKGPGKGGKKGGKK